MKKGRPMRDFRNNWHPSWLPVLECGVKRVLNERGAYNARLHDVDELVNVVWYSSMRRLPPEEKAYQGCWRFINAEIRSTLVEYCRKAHKYKVKVSNLEGVNPPVYNNTEVMDNYQAIKKQLTPRTQKIFELKVSGLNCREIGDVFGLTDERVRQIIRDEIQPVAREVL